MSIFSLTPQPGDRVIRLEYHGIPIETDRSIIIENLKYYIDQKYLGIVVKDHAPPECLRVQTPGTADAPLYLTSTLIPIYGPLLANGRLTTK